MLAAGGWWHGFDARSVRLPGDFINACAGGLTLTKSLTPAWKKSVATRRASAWAATWCWPGRCRRKLPATSQEGTRCPSPRARPTAGSTDLADKFGTNCNDAVLRVKGGGRGDLDVQVESLVGLARGEGQHVSLAQEVVGDDAWGRTPT